MQSKTVFFSDINECDTVNCVDHAECDNTLGGYSCTCKNGYTPRNDDEGILVKCFSKYKFKYFKSC